MQSWRSQYAYLQTVPIAQLWEAATPTEQRQLLTELFESIEASPHGLRFSITGLQPTLELDWQEDVGLLQVDLTRQLLNFSAPLEQLSARPD